MYTIQDLVMLQDLFSRAQAHHRESITRVAAGVFEAIFAGDLGHETPTQEEVYIGQTKGKVPMVKALRERTNHSLSDCVRIVNTYFTEHNYTFKPYR